jgi:hypothetical protein
LWGLATVDCVGLKPVQRIVNLRGLQGMCGETMSQVGFGMVSASIQICGGKEEGRETVHNCQR